ncbi:MAG: chemotaxis protein CheW [Proteobacteria bacterium]|nr:chemotaxis protein CheW [Pseudomonadota bacterium]
MTVTSPFQMLELLDTRCRKNSVGLPLVKKVVDDWIGIGFKINGIPLLAKMEEVSEILPPPQTIRVPGVKAWVRGLANIRGSLMPVLDMKDYLFGVATKINKNSRVLVINKSGLVAALLVEEVFGLRRFKQEELKDEVDPDTGSVKDYLAGTFVDQVRRWNVFSVDKLVKTEQFIKVV